MKLHSLDDGRKKLGYTNEMMAEIFNISTSYWYAIKAMKRKPGRDLMLDIARFFGQPVEQLFFPYFSTNSSRYTRQPKPFAKNPYIIKGAVNNG